MPDKDTALTTDEPIETKSYEKPELIELGEASVLILGGSGSCCDNTTDSSQC